MLLCKKCKQIKPYHHFSKHSGCKSGYDTSACKQCKKSSSDWKKVPLEKRIFNRAKHRAKKRGIPFEIELEDIIIPEVCPVFLKPFIYGHIDWTYSLDRINPRYGYIKGNIAVISNKANRIKNDATLDELKEVCRYLQARI